MVVSKRDQSSGARLILNLSMLGARPTGLGVYSEHCAAGIEARFDVDVIAGAHVSAKNVVARVPAGLGLGEGKLVSLWRQLWLAFAVRLKRDSIVYSPTHHGIANARKQIITIHDLI